MKQYLGLVVVATSLSAAQVFAQDVFTNGVDVSGYFVWGNGMMTLESTTNTQADAYTRDLAPSVGQMAGVNPDTGAAITLNGDLLTLKPQVFDLTTASNRKFVISAEQLAAGTGITVSYQGSNIVFSVTSGSIGVDQLDLTSVDGRYIQASAPVLADDLDAAGSDIDNIDDITFANGEIALSGGTNAHCRFSGDHAGVANSGNNVVGIGEDAAESNDGSYVNAIGKSTADTNEGDYVNAMGYATGRGNTANYVNAMGSYTAKDNSGSYLVALGESTASDNSGRHVVALGQHAGDQNTGNNVNAIGVAAARRNLGHEVSALGELAGEDNVGTNVFAGGYSAARNNAGDEVTAIGFSAAENNIGSNVVAIGESSATANSGRYLYAIGRDAGDQNSGDNVSAIG
jgi:hypothetical protein